MWRSEPHPGCCSKMDSCNKPERQYLSDKAQAIFTSCAVNFSSQADGRGSRTVSLFNVGMGWTLQVPEIAGCDEKTLSAIQVSYLHNTHIAPSIMKRFNKHILLYKFALYVFPSFYTVKLCLQKTLQQGTV